MKKILLGTTALVAAAGFAGIASAQEVTTKATSLAISGSVEFEGAYADNDGGGRKVDFLSDGGLTFSPKYVADNGLSTTGRLDFEYSDGGTFSPNELSITFASASFGSLTLGDDDGAVDTFYQQGPLAGDGQWDGSATRFVTTDWAGDSIEQNLNGDATKIFYSTSGLDLAGFTFGASYTPKAESSFDTGTLAKRTFLSGVSTAHDSGLSDLWDFGGSWEGEFSGVSLSLGGAVITGKRDYSDNDPTVYNFGGTVGFGALKVGGGMTTASDLTSGGDDFNEWAVGVTYDIGAFTVGATYDKASYENTNVGFTSAGVVTPAHDSTAYGVAVNYAVAPGVDARAELNQFKDDDAGDDTTVVMVGTKVSF